MDTRKQGVLASGLLLPCVLHVFVGSTQTQASAGIVYGIEHDIAEKNIFALDFFAGLGIEPSITLVANVTTAAAEDPDYPVQCIG
ncbi:hypothetical protein FVE85_0012 [Porphyridium purpureum]|uniref:Uncharacterized protein n=1 Tax=Porphyridium purpureum TaxID=35688 RepID=A0A5J4YRI9_PORPP|nr:hypothetical protein FVE85_5022 [Porphyridium purpureum]KAA8496283.1 hypothetical protein FVE85_0012 [Porphyridium purpureum]|eukprot:POR2264..scf236_6